MSDTFTITTEAAELINIIMAHEDDPHPQPGAKMLQDGLVTVNGNPVKANFKVTAGDVVTVTIPEVKPLKAVAEPIPLEIVYEDDQSLWLTNLKAWLFIRHRVIRTARW